MLKSEIAEQFDNYGVDISPAVLDKCVEICIQYDIKDANILVDEWMAYTVSKLNGADPTLETLDLAMAEAEFTKPKVAVNFDPKLANDLGELKIYNAGKAVDDDDEIIGAYIGPTSPKRKTARPIIAGTPKSAKPIFSPASYSPLTPMSRKAAEDAGKACCTFGQSNIVKSCQWLRCRQTKLNISLFNGGNYIKPNELYMMDSLFQGTLIGGEKIYSLGEKIHEWQLKNTPKLLDADKNGEEVNDNDGLNLQHCDVAYKSKIKCLGGIYIEEATTNNAQTVYLIGMDETKFRKVRLDLSKLKSYSFFSGQVALVEGMNLVGNTLTVENVCTSTILQNSPAPKLAEPISMIICSGPFTSKEDLSYQPLTALISYCIENEPDVIIFTGPFLSVDHPGRKTMAVRYDEHFEKMLTEFANSISPNTQILIIASHKDVNSTFVYPTHPYRVKNNNPNIRLLPDPCIVEMDELSVGLTSTDIISHFASHEVSINDTIDKTKRAVNYLFNQNSFYPLRPPAKDVPLDVGLADTYCRLETLPNLMILPSKSREFIRDYNGCLCINPGSLSDDNVGRFARIMVYPPATDKSKPYSYVVGQIINI